LGQSRHALIFPDADLRLARDLESAKTILGAQLRIEAQGTARIARLIPARPHHVAHPPLPQETCRIGQRAGIELLDLIVQRPDARIVAAPQRLM